MQIQKLPLALGLLARYHLVTLKIFFHVIPNCQRLLPLKHPLTLNPKAKHPKDQLPPKPQSPHYDQNQSANFEIGRIHYPQLVKKWSNL